jgi:membrane protein DedA with SNARE-associated domain
MDYIDQLVQFYMANINYLTITVLMAVESSLIPFPSEIVIPPAAWKAAQGELNVVLVVLCGVAGSIIGAIFNYVLALTLGRKVLHAFARTKFAHFLLIDEAGVVKAEQYFDKHGASATFFGRLIPAVRQLISLPAGLARMHFGSFLFFTTLGAGIWCAVLAALGYFLYSQADLLAQFEDWLKWGGIALAVLFVAYLLYNGLRKRPAATAAPADPETPAPSDTPDSSGH